MVQELGSLLIEGTTHVFFRQMSKAARLPARIDARTGAAQLRYPRHWRALGIGSGVVWLVVLSWAVVDVLRGAQPIQDLQGVICVFAFFLFASLFVAWQSFYTVTFDNHEVIGRYPGWRPVRIAWAAVSGLSVEWGCLSLTAADRRSVSVPKYLRGIQDFTKAVRLQLGPDRYAAAEALAGFAEAEQD